MLYYLDNEYLDVMLKFLLKIYIIYEIYEDHISYVGNIVLLYKCNTSLQPNSAFETQQYQCPSSPFQLSAHLLLPLKRYYLVSKQYIDFSYLNFIQWTHILFTLASLLSHCL